MQHHEIVPSTTCAPAPLFQLFSTLPSSIVVCVGRPPVIVSRSTVEPPSTVITRLSSPDSVCLIAVRSMPWPASVTPPVTISCASISKRPAASVTVPGSARLAAASIASWIVFRVSSGVSPGRMSPDAGSVVKLPLVAAPIGVAALLETVRA